jgi:BASS family bile acid:Na+ symporter
MQNSGLGVVLARRHFADPLTAVPGAISAVCHSVLGSICAGSWRLRPADEGAVSKIIAPQPAAVESARSS